MLLKLDLRLPLPHKHCPASTSEQERRPSIDGARNHQYSNAIASCMGLTAQFPAELALLPFDRILGQLPCPRCLPVERRREGERTCVYNDRRRSAGCPCVHDAHKTYIQTSRLRVACPCRANVDRRHGSNKREHLTAPKISPRRFNSGDVVPLCNSGPPPGCKFRDISISAESRDAAR